MRATPIRAVIVLALMCVATMAMLTTATADVEHCPDHQTELKIEAEDSDYDGNLVLADGTLFCLKGGPSNTGELIADGSKTLAEYGEENLPTVGKGNRPAISYVVIYGDFCEKYEDAPFCGGDSEPKCEVEQDCEPIFREREEVTKWVDGEYECGDTTVTQTRTRTTYSEISYDNGLTWEPDGASALIDTRTRDLKPDEIIDCPKEPEVVPPPVVLSLAECDVVPSMTVFDEENVIESVNGEVIDFGGEDSIEISGAGDYTFTYEAAEGYTLDEDMEPVTVELVAATDCPDEIVEVVCPDGGTYNEATGKCELPDSGFGSAALALAGLSSIGAGIATLRRKR